jgi:hypothetical protein
MHDWIDPINCSKYVFLKPTAAPKTSPENIRFYDARRNKGEAFYVQVNVMLLNYNMRYVDSSCSCLTQ